MRSSLCILCFAAACLGGCGALAFKGSDSRPEARPLSEWSFRPVSMRVHPFTSLSRQAESDTVLLSVRMELVDPAGDVTKDAGTFRFELYAVSTKASRAGDDRRLYVWDGPILTLEQNKAHYDPITRTYQFNLTLDAPPPRDQGLKLVVQFDATGGKRLLAEAAIKG